MLSRVVVTAVLVLAAMVAVKQNVLHQTGLTGSCAAVQTLSDGSQWLMCTAGKVGGGRPSLASHSCTSAGLRGTAEWWHCPAQIVSSAAGQ
jgi:hypothetical protein